MRLSVCAALLIAALAPAVFAADAPPGETPYAPPWPKARDPLVLSTLSANGVEGLWIDLKPAGSAEDPEAQTNPNQSADRDPALALALAINGGGYRSNAWAWGAMMALETLVLGTDRTALAEVDAFSTVSGGGFPVLRMLAAWRHEGAKRALSQPGAVEDDLRALCQNLDMVALLSHNPDRRASRLARALLERRDRDLLLSQLQRADLPLWVPNAARLPDGALVPLELSVLRKLHVVEDRSRRDERPDIPATLALWASAAVPGAIPPVRLDSQNDQGQGRSLWVFDGAWADRLGLLTALDLARQMVTPSGRAAVVVVDSRPMPQFHKHAFTKGKLRYRPLQPMLPWRRRSQLIGYGLELLRNRADELLSTWIFGGVSALSPNDVQMRVLEYEGMDNPPPIVPVGRTVGVKRQEDDPSVPVTMLRIGPDILLQPALWDEGKRNDACVRIASRMYTVVAVQPTDMSFFGPAYIEESDIAPHINNDRHVYPYGQGRADVRDRQYALIAAGYLAGWLQQNRLLAELGGDAILKYPRAPDQFFAEVAPVVFRSHQVAEEWRLCTGLSYDGGDNQDWDNCAVRAQSELPFDVPTVGTDPALVLTEAKPENCPR